VTFNQSALGVAGGGRFEGAMPLSANQLAPQGFPKYVHMMAASM